MPFLPLDGSTGAAVIDFQSVVLTLATRRLLDSSFRLAGIPGRITGGGEGENFAFNFPGDFLPLNGIFPKWDFFLYGVFHWDFRLYGIVSLRTLVADWKPPGFNYSSLYQHEDLQLCLHTHLFSTDKRIPSKTNKI